MSYGLLLIETFTIERPSSSEKTSESDPMMLHCIMVPMSPYKPGHL